MSILKHPTKTTKIEKAWLREINRRWSAFSKSALSRFVLINNETIANAKPVGMSPDQLRAYMVFINREIDRLLLSNEPPLNWQNQYQLESYLRAIERNRAELLRQGVTLQPSPEEIALGSELTGVTARPSLGVTAAFSPIHRDALEFLYVRAYESLKGWTDQMAREVRQIAFNAIQEGDGIDETVRKLRKRIDVSKSRARLIARTETVQAYQQSSTNEAERLQDELGETMGMRWITSLDSKVRHLHANWHGTIVSPQENRRRIGQSPFNCRCAQLFILEDQPNLAKKNEKFSEERKQMLAIERQ